MKIDGRYSNKRTRSAFDDFAAALYAADIVPDFSGNELAINVPGHGVVKWTEAVQRGLVKVSRN